MTLTIPVTWFLYVLSVVQTSPVVLSSLYLYLYSSTDARDDCTPGNSTKSSRWCFNHPRDSKSDDRWCWWTSEQGWVSWRSMSCHVMSCHVVSIELRCLRLPRSTGRAAGHSRQQRPRKSVVNRLTGCSVTDAVSSYKRHRLFSTTPPPNTDGRLAAWWINEVNLR